MARFESEGTWFDPKLVAQRERKARAESTVQIQFYTCAPNVGFELQKIYDRYDRKGVLADQAMATLQEYHGAVGRLLEWCHAAAHRRRYNVLRDPFLRHALQRAVLQEATVAVQLRGVLEEDAPELRRGEVEIVVRRGR